MSRMKIAVGLPAAALCLMIGVAPARADTSMEKYACQYLDDPTGPKLGYTHVEYAFMLLGVGFHEDEGEDKDAAYHDAALTIRAAVRDYCPQHESELPANWR